ncbi:MAG: glycosyl transferase [Mucilaginibacter sp.]|nr:glycosyl transferase [Mucilaginibacter sp.]
MKIVQSTWVRYHHIDLARELHQMGHLERVFTSLPWWKADKESLEQNVPRDLITCNFLMEGVRRMGAKLPFYSKGMDARLAVLHTKNYSRWVARNLPDCDAYIGISGSGLHAGKVAKSRGAGYIMDRGSSHIRYVDEVMSEEYRRLKLPWTPINPWLIENEEAEAEEANIITVPSEFSRKTFIGQGTDPNKLRVVPYGVSLKEFYPVGKASDDCFRIVFVGQLSVRKGILYLLDAFHTFKHPKKELILVGNIDNSIKHLIDAGVHDNIRFVGNVPRDQVKKYVSTAHALVLPSIEDGFGLVLIQAAACGCPLIASTNTGFSTLFSHEKEGLLVEARNAQALADAFTRLADDPSLRERMSVACVERVKELGGWKTYADSMVAVAREANTLASSKHLNKIL